MALDKELLDSVFKKQPKKTFSGDVLQSPNNAIYPVISKKHRVFDKVEKLSNPDPSQEKTSDKLRINQSAPDKEISADQQFLNGFSSLTGVQRRIVVCLYEACKITRSKITDPIAIEHVASFCDTTRLSVQKSIQRLEKKKIILRKAYKAGRGGWTRYELLEEIYQEVLHDEKNKPRTNIGQIGMIQPDTLKTPHRKALPQEWLDINYFPLESIGFSADQLHQLYEKNLNDPVVVQKSINHFAYGLQHNDNVKQYAEPLNVLMGVLRKGNGWVEQNYESPQERAMREFVEREKAQKSKQQSLTQQAQQLAFETWVAELSEDQKFHIIPRQYREKESMHKGFLHNHFLQSVWPELQAQLSDVSHE